VGPRKHALYGDAHWRHLANTLNRPYAAAMLPYLKTTVRSTVQFAPLDSKMGYWTTRGYANSRIANSRTGRLADWTSRGLVNSRTRQLAYWTSRGQCTVRELAIRELASPRVVQLPFVQANVTGNGEFRIWVAASPSGNGVAHANVVTLRRARLVLRSVTVPSLGV